MAGRGCTSLVWLATPRDNPMVRIVRREQERELVKVLALRQSSTRLPSAVGREAALVELGRLAVGDSGRLLEPLRPRVDLEANLEARRRGSARLARRSDALVRRVRRRDIYPRPTPSGEVSTALLGLTPEVAERARVRVGDLLDLCQTLAEVLTGLDAFARALRSLPPAPIARADVLANRDCGADQARAASGSVEGSFPDGLTGREVEVLMLVAEGKTSKEIAAELCVAVPTVSRHLANIYAKIDARGRADATRYALERLPDERSVR